MKVYVQLDKKVKKRPHRPPQHANTPADHSAAMETQKTAVENSPHAQTCKVLLSSYDFLRCTQASPGPSSTRPPPYIPPDEDEGGRSHRESLEKIQPAGAKDVHLLALPRDVTRRRHSGLMGSERSSEREEGDEAAVCERTFKNQQWTEHHSFSLD